MMQLGRGGEFSNASLKLRYWVLKEAKLLPNNTIDMFSFMDACVNVGRSFVSAKPSKILTTATMGLVVMIRKFAGELCAL